MKQENEETGRGAVRERNSSEYISRAEIGHASWTDSETDCPYVENLRWGLVSRVGTGEHSICRIERIHHRIVLEVHKEENNQASKIPING